VLDYVTSSEAVLALPDEVQFTLAVALVALFAYYVWLMPITVLRGAFAVLFAPREQSALMRETPSGLANRALHALLGLPPLTDFARASRVRYAGIVALTLLASLFLAGAALAAVAMPMWLFNSAIRTRQYYPDLVWPLVALPFWLGGIFLLLSVVGRAIER